MKANSNANRIVFISTGTTSTSGEHSKSDSSVPDVHGNMKSADNGNKKQTEVVVTQDSNGTDLHDNRYQIGETLSPTVSSVGMCPPICIVDIVYLIFQVHILQLHVHSMIWVAFDVLFT